MRAAALRSYQDGVIAAREDRTDYSGNVYKELSMLSLD